ncbi:MAG: DUF937 domain-containing protein [Vicinamibacterales bacterium]
MDLLQMVLGAQGGAPVAQLAQQFGLSQDQTVSAVSALVPALAAGMKGNASQAGGLESLLGALTSGQHSSYLDDPSQLAHPSAIDAGNGILGHVLGSKDVSRQVATQAAASTGLSPDLLKSMLPMVAMLAMGSLGRHTQTAAAASSGADGVLGMLGSLLDSNKDGSIADDVMGLAGKFLSGR